MPKRSELTVEQRREAVLALLRREEPAAPLARRYGLSEQTLYRWRDDLLAAGEAALAKGKNGSGAQLALELQARGVGSIRFDKVGSGVNMPKSAAPADLEGRYNLADNGILAIPNANSRVLDMIGVNDIGGAVTIGLAHYSTMAEVDQLVRALASLG